MTLKLSNNATSYLASVLGSSATTLTLVAGGGALFPALAAGDYFFLTIANVSGTFEIVKVTARTGDSMTIVRAQEGTTAIPFTPGAKVELRVTAGNLAGVAGSSVQISAVRNEHRPGDSVELFTLTSGTATDSVDGAVIRATGVTRIEAAMPTPVEPSKPYRFQVAYRRFADSNDPANDGIVAGVRWLNGFKNEVGTSNIISDNTLLVSSGRRTSQAIVGQPGTSGATVFAPTGARYAVPFFQTYGGAHQTDIEVCSLDEAQQALVPPISASSITFPPEFQWPAGSIPAGAGVSDPYTVARTLYVTMTGNDSNAGTSLSAPKATVGNALAAAAAASVPTIVVVHPGDYTVQPNTVIPANCALYGYDLRVTKLRLPLGQEENNMFQMSNGIKARGFSFANLRHEAPPVYASTAAGLAAVAERAYFKVGSTLYRKVNGVADAVEYDYPPAKGWAFVFKPNEFITRSPYIADCSQIHEFSQDQMYLPVDRAAGNPLMPRGGGNLFADGAVLAPSSPLRSVVVDSFTAINPNGYGYLVARNALVQLVSVFTNWSRYGLWCHDGGQLTVANSNTTFGDYSFAATGFRNVVQIPDPVGQPRAVYTAAADTIEQDETAIINEMYTQLASEFTVVQNFTSEQEQFTRRDAGTLLRQIEYDLRSGQDRGAQAFVKGLFNWNGQYVFSNSLLPIFIRSFEILEARINARGVLVSSAMPMITSLFTLVKTNLSTPSLVVFPSVLEVNSQQFSYSGTGVNYNALPYGQRGTGFTPQPQDTILQLDGGRVYATFSTERGDTYLGTDLRVDFGRSTIEGQAFSRGVQNIALPLIIGFGVPT